MGYSLWGRKESDTTERLNSSNGVFGAESLDPTGTSCVSHTSLFLVPTLAVLAVS